MVESKQPELRALQIAMIALSTVAVTLRIVSRKISRVGWWWDDGLAIFSWALVMAENGVILWAIQSGMGLHEEDVMPHLVSAIRAAYFIMILVHPCLASSKLVIVLFYARIFTTPTLRRAIWIVGAATLLWLLATFPVIVLWCLPVNKGWNPTAIPGHCINLKAFFIGQSIPNVIINLALLSLPIWFVWQLQMNITSKIGLSSVFCIGIFEAAISIVRLVTFAHFQLTDPTWNQAPSILYSSLEVNFGVICASLMATGPLLKYIISKDGSRSTRPYKTHDSRGTMDAHKSLSKPPFRSLHGEEFERMEGSKERLTNAVAVKGRSVDGSEAEGMQLDEILVTRDVQVIRTVRD